MSETCGITGGLTPGLTLKGKSTYSNGAKSQNDFYSNEDSSKISILNRAGYKKINVINITAGGTKGDSVFKEDVKTELNFGGLGANYHKLNRSDDSEVVTHKGFLGDTYVTVIHPDGTKVNRRFNCNTGKLAYEEVISKDGKKEVFKDGTSKFDQKS